MNLIQNHFYIYTTRDNLYIGKYFIDQNGNAGFSRLWYPNKIGGGYIWIGVLLKNTILVKSLPIELEKYTENKIMRDFEKNFPNLFKNICENFPEYFI